MARTKRNTSKAKRLLRIRRHQSLNHFVTLRLMFSMVHFSIICQRLYLILVITMIFFNEPPEIDLNELIYRCPSNRLINMMMDASRYAHSKIQPYIDKRVGLVDSDSDAESIHSPLLGEAGFGEDKYLSQDTIEEFCRILPRRMPFNSHLHARHEDDNVKNCWCPCSPPI